jgi:hypothetical protein
MINLVSPDWIYGTRRLVLFLLHNNPLQAFKGQLKLVKGSILKKGLKKKLCLSCLFKGTILSDGSPLVCLLKSDQIARDGKCYKYDLGQWNVVGRIPDLHRMKTGFVLRMLHFRHILLAYVTGSHLVVELQIFFFSLFFFFSPYRVKNVGPGKHIGKQLMPVMPFLPVQLLV